MPYLGSVCIDLNITYASNCYIRYQLPEVKKNTKITSYLPELKCIQISAATIKLSADDLLMINQVSNL